MSGGLRTSVKGYLLAQRLTLASDPLLENETINNNVTAPLDPPIQPVQEITMDSTTYGLGICDGNIPCFPILSSTAKNLASYGTRSTERPPHQGVNLNSSMLSVSVSSSPQTEGEILHSFNLKSFHFDELGKAARNFHHSSVVGRGGFGYVFKGWIDMHSFTPAKPGTGMAIAIRRLNEPFESDKEWSKKFNTLGQLSHPNLVKLIGYCINRKDNTRTRFLVYEFMSEGSLEDHLFTSELKSEAFIGSSFGIHNCSGSGASHFKKLSWNLRMKIALGAAKGLAFLHSNKANVIFVDFQTSKVLLDSNYNVRLCGYAPAKERLGHYRRQLIYVDELSWREDEWCRDVYTAPEYRYSGKDSLTSKSDVYSFGIFLLEILSSRRAFDKEFDLSDYSDLLRLAFANISKVDRIIDPRLEGQYSMSGAVKALDLAIRCLSKKPRSRPDMYQVIEILEELQSSS